MFHIFTRFLAGLALILMAGTALAQSEYRLQPGDSLTIEVLEDATLNRAVLVLPDGRFNFPFAGSLQAAGRTVGEIEAAVASAIASNFASRPTVFVSARPLERALDPSDATLADSETIDIYFLGEVNNPGLVAVKPGTTLLQAMAIGGGVTRFAAIKRIQLRRTDQKTGVQDVVTLNYKALANGTASNVIELKDGDVILVPERRLFE